MFVFTALRSHFFGSLYWVLLAFGAMLPGLISLGAQPAKSQSLARNVIKRVPTGTESRFLEENETAMRTMMARMAVRPTGDVDRDFVAMMVPHHQGAIDMARAELRYGHNKALLRIAQEIVVEQDQEIAVMRGAFGTPAAPQPEINHHE